MTNQPDGLLKPLKGEPCNGCGVCCIAEPCPVSKELWESPVCPALTHDGSRYYCGLMTQPEDYLNLNNPSEYENTEYIPTEIFSLGKEILASYFQMLIGRGVGCDSEDDAK